VCGLYDLAPEKFGVVDILRIAVAATHVYSRRAAVAGRRTVFLLKASAGRGVAQTNDARRGKPM
jgi:hypothetical protein